MISSDRQRTHINVLGKAFAVLEFINRRNGCTAGDIARGVSLPRGTAFRVAETLVRDGLLAKEATTGGYWLTRRVLALSQGYVSERWVPLVAPVLQALGDDLMWPVNIATPDGIWMEVRCATDAQNPFVYRGLAPGYRYPLVANGYPSIHLAFHDQAHRLEVLTSCHDAFSPQAGLGPWLGRMMGLLDEMKEAGYFALTNAKSTAIAVPLVVGGAAFGNLAMWSFPRSMTAGKMLDRHLGKLISAKVRIEALLLGGVE